METATTPTASRSVASKQEGRGLRAGALGLGGGIAVALGSVGPTASIALTLAALTSANSFASPITILIAFVPMFGIAIAFRALNRWRVDCGATYEWAGRAISPYFGFLSGWLILLAYYVGAISIVLPIGPYFAQLIGLHGGGSTLVEAIVGAVALVIVTGFLYVGTKGSARLSWVLIVIEYVVITVLAIVCLIAVFGGNSHSVAFHWSWFSWTTLGGGSGLIAGFLSAVYLYSGWDTAVLVNEETENSAVTPGAAVLISVSAAAVLFAFFIFAFEGAIKPGALQAHGGDALFYIAQVLSGSVLAKFVVLAVLLSAVGSTLGTVLSGARITFSMASRKVLPPVLARTHARFQTPTVATVLTAAFAFVVIWPYTLGSSSVENSFNTVVDLDGLLFSLFYAATGIAVAVYYRRLARHSITRTVAIILFPLASALFLLYISYKAVPGLGGWHGASMISLYVLLAIGAVIAIWGRLLGRSDYYHQPLEAYDPARAAEEQLAMADEGSRLRPL